MGTSLEARFARYGEAMVAALGHADRAAPARWYLQGLMLPGGRKSVEPMAARVRPQEVRSTHQSMHHLVSTSDWSDEATPADCYQIICRRDQRCPWSNGPKHFSNWANLRAISHVIRGDNETAGIHLKERHEVLPVSRSYLHLFRTM